MLYQLNSESHAFHTVLLLKNHKINPNPTVFRVVAITTFMVLLVIFYPIKEIFQTNLVSVQSTTYFSCSQQILIVQAVFLEEKLHFNWEIMGD